jgi:hypothetical protein
MADDDTCAGGCGLADEDRCGYCGGCDCYDNQGTCGTKFGCISEAELIQQREERGIE